MIDITYITSKSDKEANRESAKKLQFHLRVAQVSPQRLSF